MGYEQYCGGSTAVHVCHACPADRIREFARTRSGGFVTKTYFPTLIANPLDAATWNAGIASGDIIMLPQTSGSYDPGDPKELKGYGDQKVSYGPRDQKLTLNDPDYRDNYAFYNEISNRSDLIPFFCTSGLVHIFDTVAIIKAKDPVADDIEAEVVWVVDCSVSSTNLPTIHVIDTISTVFTCPTP